VASASFVLPVVPTAVHEIEDVQDTPRSLLAFASLGLGVAWIDHSVPFQYSANVFLSDGIPNLMKYVPTAVHEVDEAQDTPSSSLAPFDSLGLGVVWIDHSVPFQRSANVFSPDSPTAIQ
jgi:hypothetical protein